MVLSLAALAACVRVPDQARFAPLYRALFSAPAVVRVYAAPIPGLRRIAVHTWFVTKATGDPHLHRWELVETPGGPFGHVRRDLVLPLRDLGAGRSFVLAELVGGPATAVIDVIERNAPSYPCRSFYEILGPNSNSFVKWVLKQSGWRVDLSRAAIGSPCLEY
jgi:hypothetical protein